MRKNKSADRVDPFGVNLKPKMFGQIVQTRIAAHEKFAVAERLDVKLRTIARRAATENFLHDVFHRDDSLNAAEFINDDAHALGVRQKQLEQFHRAHRLGDERRCNQLLGVMGGGSEKKNFYIDDAEYLIGRSRKRGAPPMSFLF